MNQSRAREEADTTVWQVNRFHIGAALIVYFLSGTQYNIDNFYPQQAAVSALIMSCGGVLSVKSILTKTYGVDAPRRIDFPDTKLTEKRSRTFSLHSAADAAFSIQSISCGNHSFIVSVKQGPVVAKQHWIEVIFQPQTASENHSVLWIETTHPDSKQIKIELAGTAFKEP